MGRTGHAAQTRFWVATPKFDSGKKASGSVWVQDADARQVSSSYSSGSGARRARARPIEMTVIGVLSWRAWGTGCDHVDVRHEGPCAHRQASRRSLAGCAPRTRTATTPTWSPPAAAEPSPTG